jgi:predicted extracellular nuclease
VGDAAVTSPPGSDASTADAAATALTLPVLRDPQAAGHPTYGTRVRVEGAIVTGVKNVGTTRGFFIQDPTATAWRGIYVFTGAAPVTISVGAIVTVSGT